MTAALWPAVGSETLLDGDEVCVVREVVLVGTSAIREIAIERPEDPPSLLQGWCDRADPAVPIPYWAEIWPASRAIARRLAAGPLLAGTSTLDLGCGLGLSGVAAGLMGSRVTFADNHPDALVFARKNARAAGLSDAGFLGVDWHEPSWARPFDLVLGADVIYDRGAHEAILGILEKLLAGGGTAWLGDPCRDIAKAFLDEWAKQHAAVTIRIEAVAGEEVASAIHELRL